MKTKVTKHKSTKGEPKSSGKIQTKQLKGAKSKPTKEIPAQGLESEEESESDLENELERENAIEELVQKSHQPEQAQEEEDDSDLLDGFESESDAEPQEPLTLPPVPTNREKKLAKKARKAAAAAAPVPSIPGAIFLSRIPHGFFEPQMHDYFSQFGTVTRLRLSRNRKTGRSKHYAYIEFASKEVAEIVAETMDGYLIHPHRLVCKVLEDVDENVWKGANKKFRKVPWQKVNKDLLERKRTKEEWEKLVKRDQKRKQETADKIKALGIEYELPTSGKRKAQELADGETNLSIKTDDIKPVKKVKGKAVK